MSRRLDLAGLSRRLRDQALRHVPSVFLSTRSIAPEQPLHVMTWAISNSSATCFPSKCVHEGLTTLNWYVDFGIQVGWVSALVKR